MKAGSARCSRSTQRFKGALLFVVLGNSVNCPAVLEGIVLRSEQCVGSYLYRSALEAVALRQKDPAESILIDLLKNQDKGYIADLKARQTVEYPRPKVTQKNIKTIRRW